MLSSRFLCLIALAIGVMASPIEPEADYLGTDGCTKRDLSERDQDAYYDTTC